jgi:hypothetical protein
MTIDMKQSKTDTQDHKAWTYIYLTKILYPEDFLVFPLVPKMVTG